MKILITGDFFVSHPETIHLDSSIQNCFVSCDYRIVNFEGPIADNNYSNLPIKSGPRLMQPASTMDILNELKVDALTLANNHLMDQGSDGYRKTVSVLKNFELLGVGTWTEAYSIKYIEKDGIKVALLNLCEFQFGMLYDHWTQGNDVVGCAWVNHSMANKLIEEGKKHADYLVAIIHAGVEMIDVPLPEWRDRYREMIDLGCDVVVAHHPHIVQGYEIYKGSPIVYSLGNFCFSGGVVPSTEEWNIGALAILSIQAGELSLELKGCQLNNNLLSLIDEKIWKNKIDNLKQYLDDRNYLQRVDENCKRLMKDYLDLFALGGLFSPHNFSFKNLARVILRKYSSEHFLNNMQCESHRWCITRALRNELQS